MPQQRDRIVLQSDVVTAASTNYAPVTGLNFAAQVGRKYHVRGVMMTSAAATTTGVRWGFSASPTTAATRIAVMGITPDGIGTIDGGGNDDYVTTASTTGGYTAPLSVPDAPGFVLSLIEAIIVPSVTQVLQLEVGPEAAAAVTVGAGSYVEWELL